MAELESTSTRARSGIGALVSSALATAPARSRHAEPASTQVSARHRRLGPGRPIPYGRALGPTLIVAAWVIFSATGVLDPRIIPAPWTVATTMAHRWATGSLPIDILSSLTRAVQGFGVGLALGVVLALLAGLTRLGDALIDGPVQIKRGIPSLGLIPLFILWLGIGESFKVAIIAIGVFIPIYINTHGALVGLDKKYVELAETLRLSRWQFVRYIVVPNALPGFFVGLRLAVVASWLALIVLEQINATSGLGYMMYKAQNYGQVDVIFVGLFIYASFGFLSNEVVRFLERRTLSWQRTLSN